MDPVSEQRLSQVHPELRSRVLSLVSALESEGFPFIRVTRGIATVAQQDALWQIGRDQDGKVTGRTVTNAKGTQSNHVLGYACDLAVFDQNGQPDWNSPGFDRIAALAPDFKLRSGASWGDRPHVELIEVPPAPSEETQQTYLEAGVTSVWAGLDLTA